MALILNKNDLRKLSIREALRKEKFFLNSDVSLNECISDMIKYKIGAILVGQDTSSNANNEIGIISKTDILMAYYSGLPLDIRARDIMVTNIFSCYEKEPLDLAINIMIEQDIKQLVVLNEKKEQIGILSFPDIVGLIYKICFNCQRNIFKIGQGVEKKDWVRVKDVMCREVKTIKYDSPISSALETILVEHIGALLVIGQDKELIGVISKTDLIIAYRHGLELDVPVAKIMSSPPVVCDPDCSLTEAIKLLILADVQRLFIKDLGNNVIGVLSFTDAARFRSGTCKACKAGNW